MVLAQCVEQSLHADRIVRIVHQNRVGMQFDNLHAAVYAYVF